MLRRPPLLEPFARLISNAHSLPKTAAFAFDIDGVLVKGSKVLPQAKTALQLLNTRQIPYIFLTNGGGVTESQKASELSSKLGMEIQTDQVVLSHSPMKRLVEKYRTKPVLIVGGRECKAVARSYGFEKAVLSADVHDWNPKIWPFRESALSLPSTLNLAKEQFAAILVMHDSRDFGLDIQICCDILRSRDGVLGTHRTSAEQSVPVYFSNSDFLFSSDFPVSRVPTS
jgi:HAD superfamily hydrolase (TIGR01456 family)